MNAQRKRAKRQTAGALVAGLLGQQTQSQPSQPKVTPSGKKSTAQPRPAVTIPPRGIGPVMEPNDNDVLCGRGGRINAHVGNVRFRELVVARKPKYLAPSTKKLEKAHIAAALVQEIRCREPSGRFLKEDPDGSWYDIGDAKAIKKVGQALREDAPEIRPEIGSDEEGAKPVSSSSNNNNVTVPLPQPAMQQQQQPPLHGFSSMSLGAQSRGTSENSSSGSKYEPIAYQHSISTQHHHNMGPPVASFHQHQYSTNARNTVSGAAAAAMQQEQDDQFDTAFGKTFHLADPNEASVISGLTNTMVSGMSGTSGMSEAAVRSNLSGHPRHQQHPQGRSPQHHHPHPQNFQAARANQLHQLRQTWEATNSNRTLQGSDLMAKAAMPAHSQRSVPRSNSWQEAMSIADMSWTEHSLAGGGIDGNASILSGRSILSQQLRNDSESLMEQLMGQQGSVASRRSRPAPYAQNLYQRSYSPTQQQQTQPQQQPRGDASVTSMSIASAGVMSLGSVRSIMSDLSENLVALDLAEPRLPDRYY
uniref:DUF6824 domain-containing protein n=1 Tax=Amphora coffeiformis TaxID=265554 RepID=A0A7S3P3Z1_9STRA|mmetsp:Transcript_8242/g.15698  ORF Transcript_8242/g.15698 Transcript_8242/m.15698 type:complete len:532 (+) Transcript_8242:231-1826(+)